MDKTSIQSTEDHPNASCETRPRATEELADMLNDQDPGSPHTAFTANTNDDVELDHLTTAEPIISSPAGSQSRVMSSPTPSKQEDVTGPQQSKSVQQTAGKQPWTYENW